ncbi:sensor histidine kinase [Candidatus Kaiserbacteria bacterium]|nr:sensor histidine kinase [Candidatus Kaiserbacteria bacterium]
MVDVNYEDQLKAVNAELYKHSREVADKNKILSLLATLYNISIETLSPKQLADEITRVVQTEFDFEQVGILLYDSTSDTLDILAFAESARFHDPHKEVDGTFENVHIVSATKHPFFSEVFTRTVVHSEDLNQVWGDTITPDISQKIKIERHIRTIFAYPLLTGQKMIGVFIFGINRSVDELIDYERQALSSVVNVTTVALDKSLLYGELQVTNERQEVLMHFIGHEVKGTLAKDSGVFASISEGDLGPVSETVKTFIDRALVESRNGASSVENILKASNLKKGSVTYTKEVFDLKELLAGVVEKVRVMAEKKGLVLTFSADEAGAPYTLNGDKTKLGDNVFRNFVENSINYTPAGSVAVSLKKESGKTVFSVKDTGIGITEEDKKRLFTEGGHGKDSQKVNAHSTGYGLFIAKQITEAHGGTVRAESEGEGKGSTFVVEFPV